MSEFDTRGGAWVVATTSSEPATFFVRYSNIAPDLNKFMATLFNTSATRKVVMQRIWRYNWRITAATGVVLDQALMKISARTIGSTFGILAYDSIDSLSSGIIADTDSTAVTANFTYKLFHAAGEEDTVGALTTANFMGHELSGNAGCLIWEKKRGCKGITLRENQGVTIKNLTDSTAGDVSYVFEFTDEPA